MEVYDDARIGINELVDSLFDALITTKEVGTWLLVSEFSLFRRLAIPMKPEVAPLKWWKENACSFLNVGFLAKKVLQFRAPK